MRFVMNALDEDQTTIVHGKHFTFKGKQIKPFQNDTIADVIIRERKEYGFVEVPKIETADEGAIEDYDRSPVGLALIEDKRKEGIDAYCARLRRTIYNLKVSLKKDLAMKNMAVDPLEMASDGDIKNMELLVKYQSKKEDANQIRLDKARKLDKALEKV